MRPEQLYTKDYGPAHCGVCGERFMGQDQAEVVVKATKEVLIIHADPCFDPAIHEVA